ncbi:MAG: nodulation protein S NodS [Euryarchaeota archaeon]|jgi:trans-aconitate methyltransferase|nr:nodulation protein S NodS [Euryarchaeota archaeon]
MTIRDATDVFSEWALRGRDEGMESGHAKSVNEMLEIAIPELKTPFSAIDVGCGNGWLCRKLASLDDCNKVVGIDGSKEMIAKAKQKGEGEFHLATLPGWQPPQKFDLIHSMEFLYYLKEPLEILKIFFNEWLEDQGILIAGIDHYLENTASHDWPQSLNVHMTTLSEEQWKQGMIDAGFIDVEIRRVGVKSGFVGTLAIFGRKS